MLRPYTARRLKVSARPHERLESRVRANTMAPTAQPQPVVPTT